MYRNICFQLRISLLHFCSKLSKKSHKSRRSHRQSPVAAVGKPKLAIEFRVLQVDQLDPPGFNLVACERRADERNTQVGRDKALDHADAGKFHSYLKFRVVGAE